MKKVWFESQWLPKEDGLAIKRAASEAGYSVCVRNKNQLMSMADTDFYHADAAFCSLEVASRFIPSELLFQGVPAKFQTLSAPGKVQYTFDLLLDSRTMPLIGAAQSGRFHFNRTLCRLNAGECCHVIFGELDGNWYVVDTRPSFGLPLIRNVNPERYVNHVVEAFDQAKCFWRNERLFGSIMYDWRRLEEMQGALPIAGIRDIVHSYHYSPLLIENALFEANRQEQHYPFMTFLRNTRNPHILEYRRRYIKTQDDERIVLLGKSGPCSRPGCYNNNNHLCTCGWPIDRSQCRNMYLRFL